MKQVDDMWQRFIVRLI